MAAENLRLREALSLYKVSEAIAASLSLDQVLETVADSCAPRGARRSRLDLARRRRGRALRAPAPRGRPRSRPRRDRSGSSIPRRVIEHLAARRAAPRAGREGRCASSPTTPGAAALLARRGAAPHPAAHDRLHRARLVHQGQDASTRASASSSASSPRAPPPPSRTRASTRTSRRPSSRRSRASPRPSTRWTATPRATPIASRSTPRSSRTRLGLSPERRSRSCGRARSCTTSARSAACSTSTSRASSRNDEYEVFKKHPAYGRDILDPIKFLHPLIPGVHLHHERWDGRGYPLKLKGNEIPHHRAHHLGRRHLRRHDERPLLPPRPAARGRRSPRSSAARRRSSTPRSPATLHRATSTATATSSAPRATKIPE